jgi:serine/threonine-protein kinase
MRVKLTPGEIEHFQTDVTSNSDAFSNFLSGNYQEEATAFTSIGKIYQDSISYERAINFYDKAIKYDSTFALAYARRSISRSSAYFTGAITGTGTIEKCKADANIALRLNPGLAEAYNADGFYYYYCQKDYKNALVCFRKASELDPGNWQPVFYTSMVYRRMGEWSNSQALIARVLKSNPQDALVLTNIATSYLYLRIYDSALIYNNMAIKLMPNWNPPYINKLKTLLLRDADTHEARLFIDTAIKNTGDRFQKDKIMLDIYDGKYTDALFKTELSEQDDFENRGDRLLHYAYINGYLGRHELAKTYYDSALVFYVKRLGKQADPLDFIQAGHAYAGLNNYAKAIQAAKKGIDLINDPLNKYDKLINVAEIYIKCGDFKNGLKKLEELLNNPSIISVSLIKLDPVWAPVKDDPEFINLLKTHSNSK